MNQKFSLNLNDYLVKQEIKNTICSSDEGTCSRSGKPIMVDVHKCPKCGYSVEK